MKISIFVFGFVFAFFFLAIHVRQGNAINEVCHKYLDLGLVSDCSACDNSTVTEDRNHTTWSFQANMDDQILECNLEPNTTQNVSGTILSIGSLAGFDVVQKFMVRIDIEARQVTRLGTFSFDSVSWEGGLVVDPVSHILFLSGALTVGDFDRFNRSKDFKFHRISTIDGTILSSVRPVLSRYCRGPGGPDCFSLLNLTIPDGVDEIQDREDYPYRFYWGGKRFSIRTGEILGRITVIRPGMPFLEAFGSLHPVTGQIRVHGIMPARANVMEFDSIQDILYILSVRSITREDGLHNFPFLTVFNTTSREVLRSGDLFDEGDSPGRLITGLLWNGVKESLVLSIQNVSVPEGNRTTRFSDVDTEMFQISPIIDAPIYPFTGDFLYSTPLQTDYSNRIYVGSAYERRSLDVIDERNICPVTSEDVSDIHLTDNFIHEPICLCCIFSSNSSSGTLGRDAGMETQASTTVLSETGNTRFNAKYTPSCSRTISPAPPSAGSLDLTLIFACCLILTFSMF